MSINQESRNLDGDTYIKMEAGEIIIDGDAQIKAPNYECSECGGKFEKFHSDAGLLRFFGVGAMRCPFCGLERGQAMNEFESEE